MVWWFPSAAAGARRGAFPLEPMEYVFMEGTAPDYDVMYDTVHAVPATPVSAAQSESGSAMAFNAQRKLVRTSDGTLHTVYMKQLAGQYQIYVKRSVDDGDTWTDETRISTLAGMAGAHQYYPCIAVDSNDYLHVVWHGAGGGYGVHQIWCNSYDGSSWAGPVRISTYANMSTEIQIYACIAVDSQGNLHVVWDGVATGFASRQIWYAKYDGSWSYPVRISTYANMATAGNQENACIAVDSQDHLHVVWHGPATGYAFLQIWYNTYDGSSWAGPVRISTYANMAINLQTHPCIAVDSEDNLHVVWSGTATGYANAQIWYNKYTDSWAGPVRISDALNMASYVQYYPSIAVDSDDYLYVVWHGKATGYTTQNVVWLAVYVVSWATPECIQPTGRNQLATLRWSRWPR